MVVQLGKSTLVMPQYSKAFAPMVVQSGKYMDFRFAQLWKAYVLTVVACGKSATDIVQLVKALAPMYTQLGKLMSDNLVHP